MSLPIDHIVIGVANLDQAIADYETLGFTVSPGGNHDNGVSHNALIHLADGTFLELFAFRPVWRSYLLRLMDRLALLNHRKKNPEYGFLGRFTKCLQGKEGFMDFAIRAACFSEEIKRMQAEGLPLSMPKAMARQRPDGLTLQWQLAFPNDLALPFVMSPYHPPQTVEPAAIRHANGALGVYSLTMAVGNWDERFQAYRNVLNCDPQIGRKQGEPLATYSLNPAQHIRLLSHSQKNFAQIQELCLSVPTDHVEKTLPFDPSHQARIRLRPSPEMS